MGYYSSRNIRMFLVDLQRDYFRIGLKRALREYQCRVATVRAYFQQLFKPILLCYFLDDASFLRTQVHHPTDLSVLVDAFYGLLGVLFRTVFKDIAQKELLHCLGTLG
jgi:hypothetical protein